MREAPGASDPPVAAISGSATKGRATSCHIAYCTEADVEGWDRGAEAKPAGAGGVVWVAGTTASGEPEALPRGAGVSAELAIEAVAAVAAVAADVALASME